MTCPNCSASYEENTAACPNCGQPCSTEASAPVVKDWLTLNIVLLAICCTCVGCAPAMATGILGVVFSTQVRSLLADGKLEEAQKKAKVTKYLAIATAVLEGATLLFIIVYFIVFFGFYGIALGSMFAEIPEIFGMLI